MTPADLVAALESAAAELEDAAVMVRVAEEVVMGRGEKGYHYDHSALKMERCVAEVRWLAADVKGSDQL